MYHFSCFADEISPDLNEQVRVMKENGIKNVALRSVWDKFILQLGDEELKNIKKVFQQNGIRVSSIGSHIGKVTMDYDFETHLKELERVIQIAKFMETPNIRIFSFFMPKEDFKKNTPAVVQRVCRMVQLAEKNDVVLLHENESEVFGDNVENCLKIYEAANSPHIRHCFDPCNIVNVGGDVWQSFQKVESYISDFHVKDFDKKKQTTTIAGQGDGEIPRLLEALKKRDFMYLTIEPHLVAGNNRKGFTGPEMFTKDYQAIVKILNDISAKYD